MLYHYIIIVICVCAPGLKGFPSYDFSGANAKRRMFCPGFPIRLEFNPRRLGVGRLDSQFLDGFTSGYFITCYENI